jgi:tetratricopeptide (TPR) repeat protein
MSAPHEAKIPLADMKRFWLAIFISGAALAADEPVAGGANELYRQGKQAVLRGDYVAATVLLQRAIGIAPRESDYHHWLGNGFAWLAATAPLGDKPALGRKCLAAYLRAIELDPDNLGARFSLMNFYRRVPRWLGGGPERAAEQAEEIHRRDPLQGAYARAVLLGDEKHYPEALATLAEVVRQHPAYYAANLAFGRLALESGLRQDEGAAALRRCLELAPAENDESHEVVTRCLNEFVVRLPTTVTVARRP